jgi:hypothetical protein
VYLEMTGPGDLCLLTDAGVVRARADRTGEAAEINLPDTAPRSRFPGGSAPGKSGCLGTVGASPDRTVPDIRRIDLPGRGRALRFRPAPGAAGANVNFVSPPTRERRAGSSGPTSAA